MVKNKQFFILLEFATPCKSLKRWISSQLLYLWYYFKSIFFYFTREKILERCIKTPTLPPMWDVSNKLIFSSICLFSVMMLSRGIYDDEDSSDHYKSFCKLNFSNIDIKEEVSVCKSPGLRYVCLYIFSNHLLMKKQKLNEFPRLLAL